MAKRAKTTELKVSPDSREEPPHIIDISRHYRDVKYKCHNCGASDLEFDSLLFSLGGDAYCPDCCSMETEPMGLPDWHVTREQDNTYDGRTYQLDHGSQLVFHVFEIGVSLSREEAHVFFSK